MKRKDFLNLLGDLPPAASLSAEVIERVKEKEFIREKIVYQSGGEKVFAYLLLPSPFKGPHPAVVAIHQHNLEFHLGKSEVVGLAGDPDMAYGLELVKEGFVVIAPDLKCFEERRPSNEEREKNEFFQNGSYERFVFCKYLLEGSTLQARYVFDLSRAVDYLEVREEVDSDRIGAIGHSLGGQETLFLMLFDERVKTGVVSCGTSLWRLIIEKGISHNFAAYLPGMLKIGDSDEFFSLICPRPLMIIAGEKDPIFPVEGVRRIGERLTRAYRDAGYPEKFQLIIHSEGHCFPSGLRQTACRWLKRWLFR